MTPPEFMPILGAAAMRDAEARAGAAGTSLATLMRNAGEGVAAAVHRLAAGAEALILCGPGNNGGDGWAAAATLARHGHPVRVAALGEPRADLARDARAAWTGPVEAFDTAALAPVVVDALFGLGLSCPLDRAIEARLDEAAQFASLAIAVDVPSGLASDGGSASRCQPSFDLTLALGTLKPAHVLYPAADHCGAVRVLDIGLDILDLPVNAAPDWSMARPRVAAPQSFDHKYSRGLVIVIAGVMPGAAALAAHAAMHAGAGYVLLFGDADPAAPPHALVRRAWSPDALASAIDGKSRGKTAIVVGPGLGHDDVARAKADAAIASGVQLIVDGDALRLLGDADFARFKQRPAHLPVVLTPHAGEFEALFGDWSGNKIDAARGAARRSGAVVVFKGPDTVVAYPDGHTRVALAASFWLSTAGTGDVLAGAIATLLTATTLAPVEAAVWMHGEAAYRLGGAFIADDLARELTAVRARL